MPSLKITNRNRNITLPYDQRVYPYHSVIADLVCKHASSEQRRVFDFGCGVGNTLCELVKRDQRFEFTIADVDPECLRITAQKAEVREPLLLDEGFDYQSFYRSYDIVIASHVLHYDPNPLHTVNRLLELLKPQGFLVIAISNPITPAKILNNLIQKRYSEGVYSWDRSVFTNFLENLVGATIVEMTQDYVPLPLLNRFSVCREFGRFLSRVSPNLSFSTIAALRNQLAEESSP